LDHKGTANATAGTLHWAPPDQSEPRQTADIDVFAVAKLAATLSKEDSYILSAGAEWIDARMRDVWGNVTVADIIHDLPEPLLSDFGFMTVYDAGLGPFLRTSLSAVSSQRTFTLSSFCEVSICSVRFRAGSYVDVDGILCSASDWPHEMRCGLRQTVRGVWWYILWSERDHEICQGN
jgi:hypothetical protein